MLTAILASSVAVFLFPPVPQSQAYHNLADKRALAGIPNFLNVASNVLFLFVGVLGIRFVLHGSRGTEARALPTVIPSTEESGSGGSGLIDPREHWPYWAFFLGVAMTTFGSAYYHLDPRDGTLLWDRIPMAISFTALVAATVSERISVAAGLWLLLPVLTSGVGSVVYWDLTQKSGRGDLRPYILTQFGSAFVIILLISLFPPRYTRGSDVIIALTIYASAKVFEAADGVIFALGGIVSGHTLKHITAAISAYWILRMLLLREAKAFPTLRDTG